MLMPLIIKKWKVGKIRISASSAKAVPIRETTSPLSYLNSKLYPSFTGNAATRKGLQLESYVIEKLQLFLGKEITRSGVHVSSTKKWLCGSPDGLTENMLIEIKCPFNVGFQNFIRNSENYDAEFNTETNTFNIMKNGRRGYYLQIQIGMFVTGKKFCLLVYYLETDDMIIDVFVAYDESFLNEKLSILEVFYYKHMLPYITSQWRTKLLNLENIESIINSTI